MTRQGRGRGRGGKGRGGKVVVEEGGVAVLKEDEGGRGGREEGEGNRATARTTRSVSGTGCMNLN